MRCIASALAAALAVAFLAAPAFAGGNFNYNITSTPATSFTSNDNTTTNLAASVTIVSTITLSTTATTGSATVGIVSPANPVGTRGATFNWAWVSVTCTFTSNLAGWVSLGAVALVPGGTANCGTAGAGVANKTATMTATFRLDASRPPSDIWSATPNFKVAGTAT